MDVPVRTFSFVFLASAPFSVPFPVLTVAPFSVLTATSPPSVFFDVHNATVGPRVDVGRIAVGGGVEWRRLPVSGPVGKRIGHRARAGGAPAWRSPPEAS